MSEFAIRQLCQQKSQRNLNPTPPVRLEVVSPYVNETITGEFISRTGITKRQLDMRRKIEILKYQNNNGKTSSKQQFSLLASSTGSVSRRSSVNDCLYTPTKTSSSNIPGPIIELTYDDTIPLYNYLQRSLAVSTLPEETNTAFRFHKVQGKLIELPFVEISPRRFDMMTPVTIGYLQFYENIASSVTSFQLNTVLKFTDISGSATVLPRFEVADHLKIFFSETEIVQKKQIGSFCVPESTSTTTLVTSYINQLPTIDGYIYQLQYYFTNFITSNPTLTCTIDPADITVQII